MRKVRAARSKTTTHGQWQGNDLWGRRAADGNDAVAATDVGEGVEEGMRTRIACQSRCCRRGGGREMGREAASRRAAALDHGSGRG